MLAVISMTLLSLTGDEFEVRRGEVLTIINYDLLGYLHIGTLILQKNSTSKYEFSHCMLRKLSLREVNLAQCHSARK